LRRVFRQNLDLFAEEFSQYLIREGILEKWFDRNMVNIGS